MFYRESGEGNLVVLLHGFGEEGTIWKHQYDLFPNHRLIIPDLPGSGKSEMAENMSMEGQASVLNDLLNKIGIEERVVLIGHSMGGYITLAFAEKYPELLQGFGLFHSTAYPDNEEKKETRRKGISFIKKYGAAAFLETAIPNLYAPLSKEAHTEWIEEHLLLKKAFSVEALICYYEAMINRPDRTAVLRNAGVPVLFVMGRHDIAVPVNDLLKQSHLPQQSYIHMLENSGHMGMIEEATNSNTLLSEFIHANQKTGFR